MGSEKVVLIDAFSQIYRSFHAVKHLSNSRGEPVNALLVFTRLLLGIEKNYASSRGAMLFDCGKVKFRLEKLPEYKATRPPMPESLAQQIPFIKEMSAAFGWQMHSVENYEADDLIGVIAGNVDGEILIVSSDKDLSQLINEKVNLLSPASGKSGGFEQRGIEYVKNKYGVLPEQMVEYLALIGDSSDNIGGVPGIGDKRAAELLNTYGNAGKWMDTPDILDKKFASKLEGMGDLIRRNIELVKLRMDIPEKWGDLDSIIRKQAPDWGKIRDLCKYYGLNSVLKDLPADSLNKNTTVSVPAAEDDLFSFAALQTAETEKSNGRALDEEDSLPVQGELFNL